MAAWGIQRRQMAIVVACGVSAGIGAIFNAPIAGVLFALEIFLKDFSFRTFTPVVFSSVISCSIMQAMHLEDHPDKAIFEVSVLREHLIDLLLLRCLGFGCYFLCCYLFRHHYYLLRHLHLFCSLRKLSLQLQELTI